MVNLFAIKVNSDSPIFLKERCIILYAKVSWNSYIRLYSHTSAHLVSHSGKCVTAVRESWKGTKMVRHGSSLLKHRESVVREASDAAE